MLSTWSRPLAAAMVAGLVATGAGATAADPVPSSAGTGSDDAMAAVRPQVAPMPDSPLGSVDSGAVPDEQAVSRAVGDELGDRWLGAQKRSALTVRDVQTEQHLLDDDANRRLTPASTTKLLTAAAVMTSLAPSDRFSTTAVQGESAREVVLVAGGDMMLDPGPGDPEAVRGRAGLGELAAQTAEALQAEGVGGPVSVRVDLDYAAGPATAPGWTDFWVANGYAGRIGMLGLDSDIAVPFEPSSPRPVQVAAIAFRDALERHGVQVSAADRIERVHAPSEPQVLGTVQSAPVRDVLAFALAASDNALTEQLARQAAVRAGAGAEEDEVTAWVLDQLVDVYDIDTRGVELADASGLSPGTTVPVRVVADVLVAGAGGEHPGLQSVLGSLPIAGYTGTLDDRFTQDRAGPAVGVARAKTGTLPGVSSLAGTVVTRDGRLLVFAMAADRIGEGGAALEAQAVQDALVAELAACGC